MGQPVKRRPRPRWAAWCLAALGVRSLVRGTSRDHAPGATASFAAPGPRPPLPARSSRPAALLPRRCSQLRPRVAAAAAAQGSGGGDKGGVVLEESPPAGRRSAGDAEGEAEEEVPFFEEVSGDDPLVLELEERLRRQNGNSQLTLDMVLNPGTIVNTEREVILLRAELKATPDGEAEKRKELEDKIEAKQMKVVNEMRQVMTDNLKLEFLSQAVLSIPIFGSMTYDKFPLIPNLEFLDVPPPAVILIFRLFGIWGLWLLTVPALRARKPGGPYGMDYWEKRALDLSFLVLPFVCIFTPFFSKDPPVTFWASLLTVAALYVWSFNTPLESPSGSRRGVSSGEVDLPEPLRWALTALDFGTGSERGARSEDSEWQDQLSKYEEAAEELAAAKRAEQQSRAEQKKN